MPDGPWAEFAKAGFYPDLSVLHFVARAITPPRRPRRFDTRFFSVDATAIAHRIENVVHPEAELVELVWLPIAEARRLDMPTITRRGPGGTARRGSRPVSATICRSRSTGCRARRFTRELL